MASVTGLLILTQPVRSIIPNLPQVLEKASKYVSRTLYVHLDPMAQTAVPKGSQGFALYSHIITSIYAKSPRLCQGTDVRVLLAGFKGLSDVPLRTSSPIDKVLFDQERVGNDLITLEERYKSFITSRDKIFLLDHDHPVCEADIIEDAFNASANQLYSSVVIGGTFDCIHEGHKILLSEGLLRCKDRFTIGVSEGPLLKNKTLTELIVPIECRINNVRELAMDIDPSVEYNIVPISEPMGPTRWDPDMDMIVVSEETKKGIELINKARKEAGLKILDGYIIGLVEDELKTSDEEEEKISASSQRMRLLGTVLKFPVSKPDIESSPYVIGLTGGSASGKSSVAKRLANLGAVIVDCDKLGHQAYKKGTNCFKQVVETFGEDIIGSDGEIDRKCLGSKVFGNKDGLKELNQMVWPEIGRLARQAIDAERRKGTKVVVLDAAVLLEAAWDSFCHQVWICIIRRAEAVKRIVERDGKSEAEAEQRVDSQLSNVARVKAANVVFCTQWSGEYTQQQVERAWNTLNCYLQQRDEHKSQL